MAVNQFMYPKLGEKKAKNISEVKNLISELNTAVGAYLKQQGISDIQGIKLPGLADAQKKVTAYQKELKGSNNELAVRGGLNEKGHLAVTLDGIIPKKGKPAKVSDEIIVRKDFAKIVAEMQNEANAVINLTKEKKTSKGDKIINPASDRQGKKFNAKVDTVEEADFGNITTGTVVLAAHGSRVEENGTIIGTKLGKKSAAEIVSLLTEQKDKKKSLSKKFTGTVLLSGCFTAAGGIAPPNSNYDYSTFAGSVAALLKRKGINCKVKGMPGTAYTRSSGDKASVDPSKQKEKDNLKKQRKAVEERTKKLAAVLTNLKKKHGTDQEAMLADPGIGLVQKEIVSLKAEAKKVKAKEAETVIEKLVGTFGLGTAR